MDVYQLDKVEKIIANDSLKLIDPYVKGIYYHYAGDYGKSNRELIYVLNNKEKYFNWYYDNAVFQYLINQLAAGNQQEINKYINKLSGRYKINFNQLSANRKLAEKFIEYERLIASNGDKNKEREIKKELSSEKKNTFYTAAYNFLSGVAKFKNEKYKEAAGDFSKNVYSDNNFYKRESVKYLMEIYSRMWVEEDLVENLIDQIDDLDNDRLSFRARDLERKYGL
jgi:hypothetical protein